jgi:hypothetical protein
MSHDGRGIISNNGKKVFIDGVLPGENVSYVYTKRHKRYDEANIILKETTPVNIGSESQFNSTNRTITVDVELYYTDNSDVSSNYINMIVIFH